MPEVGGVVGRADGASARVTVARDALLEIAPADQIGDVVSEAVGDDGVITLQFAALMLGYPGWYWTVSVVELAGEEPTVLEAELLPGDGALLAPEWVPWSDRMEEWKAAESAEAAARRERGDDERDGDGSDGYESDGDESDGDGPDGDGPDGDAPDDDSDDEDDEDDDSDEGDGDEDDEEPDDDFGDDVYDGLDPESAIESRDIDDADDIDDAADSDEPTDDRSVAARPPALEVDEAAEPEADSDDDGPQPDGPPIGEQGTEEDQKRDQGE